MNAQAILVIGDDSHSLRLLLTTLRDHGYHNVIAGNQMEVNAELQEREDRKVQQEEMFFHIFDTVKGMAPIQDLYKLKHPELCQWVSPFDHKPPPHYRVNFRTGKPLRF